MKASYYLDTRRTGLDEAPLKIVIYQHGTRANIDTGVRLRPDQWTGEKVINHPKAVSLNNYLRARKAGVDSFTYQLMLSFDLEKLDAAQIRDRYLESTGEKVSVETHGYNFVRAFRKYAKQHTAPSTKEMYDTTLKKLKAFDENISERGFDDIDKDYLLAFDKWMSLTLTQNSRNIYLRCIRTVFNSAIDDELTSKYPFRKVKIKAQATKDRSLSPETLRKLLACEVSHWQEEYRDIFFLSFYLIGINIGDLALLKEVSDGRIEYDRLKTHKHYSIKVEPEAQAILDKYKGDNWLLPILDRYSGYKDYGHRLNDGLKTIGLHYEAGKKPTGKAVCSDLTTYYARYSWATIAAELDIPHETIAAALGHTRMDVTAIYIRTDMKRKIDEANRKVIDYVLYGKK